MVEALVDLVVFVDEGLDFFGAWGEAIVDAFGEGFVDGVALVFDVIEVGFGPGFGAFFGFVDEVFSDGAVVFYKVLFVVFLFS